MVTAPVTTDEAEVAEKPIDRQVAALGVDNVKLHRVHHNAAWDGITTVRACIPYLEDVSRIVGLQSTADVVEDSFARLSVAMRVMRAHGTRPDKFQPTPEFLKQSRTLLNCLPAVKLPGVLRYNEVSVSIFRQPESVKLSGALPMTPFQINWMLIGQPDLLKDGEGFTCIAVERGDLGRGRVLTYCKVDGLLIIRPYKRGFVDAPPAMLLPELRMASS
jgi:hypothetical protein